MENVDSIDIPLRITSELKNLSEPISTLKTEFENQRAVFKNSVCAVLMAGALLLDTISSDVIHFHKRENKAFQEAVINSKKDAEEFQKQVLVSDAFLSSRRSKMELKA
jgi:hypothetical protein